MVSIIISTHCVCILICVVCWYYLLSFVMLLKLRSTSTKIFSPLKAFSSIFSIPQWRIDIFCRFGRFLMNILSSRILIVFSSNRRTWTSAWRFFGMDLKFALVQFATFLPLLHLHSQPRQFVAQSPEQFTTLMLSHQTRLN